MTKIVNDASSAAVVKPRRTDPSREGDAAKREIILVIVIPRRLGGCEIASRLHLAVGDSKLSPDAGE
ncbi:MAG: hypothetical protein JO213_14590 [Alphaproteobacteria bacterium]|nr:hypothetical protein [Alphaproteobacteria bacterium]MBV9151698.1 hypothetical protein [Alphaproteobacteria bacterium]MBV9586100.1 hypothetical protein [Alphaproteobacteria bacterium]MBV9967916.1 hypothetical protein [Alphaproteobacteria bacterium]